MSIQRRALLAYGAAAGLILLGLWFYLYAVRPVAETPATATVNIHPGAGFRQIVGTLDQAGLVQNRPFFYLLAFLKHAHRQIKAGEYEFSTALSPAEILDKLVSGTVKGYRVTIPEDWTLREIARRLAQEGLAEEKAFLDLAANRAFLASLRIEAASAEGYVFPSTYFFTKSMSEGDILRAMVQQFWKVFTPEMQQRAARMGLTVSEAVTLASIIGKESGYSREKPLIAAVFYNRLRQGMKLQSDPTAVYGLGSLKGPVTRGHLKRQTAYNTYVIQGLPPGPIANPGSDSLQAVLYPAPVPYLYFVSQNDGTHFFSSNLAGHREAVSRYLMEKRRQKQADAEGAFRP